MSNLLVSRLRAIVPAGLLVGLFAHASLADAPKAKNHATRPAEAVQAPQVTDMPSGDSLSKWKVDDADPVKSVPGDKERDSDPLQFGYYLMDLAEKGGTAAKKGDHRAAVRYYAALAKAVPDRSVSFSKLCTSYEALGDWEKAVDACRTALGLQGVTVADSSHFVRLLLAKRTPLTPTEIEDATAVVEHLQADEATQMLANDLNCEIGVRIEDIKRLEKCTAALAAAAGDDPRTISYQWALALAQKDYAGARAIIERAKASTISPEGIHHMEAATQRVEPLWRKGARDWRFSGGAAVVAAAAIAAFLMRRRSALMLRS